MCVLIRMCVRGFVVNPGLLKKGRCLRESLSTPKVVEPTYGV